MSHQVLKLEPKFHPKQLEIFNSKARFRVVMAGRQSGKSYFVKWDMIIFALTHANSLVWYVAPTYGQAKSICWRDLIQLIPKEAVHKIHETELFIEMVNGSRIELKGCDNENSLRGRAPDYIVLDETAFMQQHIWEEILRPALTTKKARATLIGTPNGKNWFWKLWQESNIGIDQSFQAFKFTTFDNPHIDHVELEMAKRQTRSSTVFNQEYMAEPQVWEGLVYTEFMRDIHVIPGFKLPKEAKIFRGIDWGIDAPCVCLWAAVVPTGEIYIFREHFRNGLPATKQAEIISMMSGQEAVEATVIDPSTRRRDMRNGGSSTYFESIQMQFTRAGIPTVLGFNNRHEGISIVKDLLLRNKLFIFDSCVKLIMELTSYEWANAAEGEEANHNEKTRDGNDDGVDTLRYLCCMLSGRMRSGFDAPIFSGQVREGNYVVNYENGNITQIMPRKVPPEDRASQGMRINEYGGMG